MIQSLLTQQFQSQFLRQPGNLAECKIVDLGLIDYQEAFRFQSEILNQRIQGKCSDALIICEHFPVFTLGRLGKEENILADKESLKSKGLEVIPVNRGGDITFHGPGQLVVYPIFNLTNYKKDLRYFLNKLEEVAIEFLKHFGCFAYVKKGFTGAWYEEKKIASIGIGVKKWVSFHGLAININTDLRFFSLIKPCGLNVEMTSLGQALNCKISMDTAKKVITEKFKEIFGSMLYLGGE